MTRDKYERRLASFLKFIGLQGNLKDQATIFAERGKLESSWALNGIVKFLQFQRDRANRKEITGGTVRNYVKSIKLFCEMADILVQRKKLTRGLPTRKNYTAVS